MMIRGRMKSLQPDWDIVEACSGDEAVAMVSALQPDFITMDVNMPGMNGFDFLRAYEQEHLEPRAPAVVMLTSSADPSDRRRAESFASVCGYVTKPLDAAEAKALPTLLRR